MISFYSFLFLTRKQGVLFCMHCYWYYLFMRILYKLLAGVKSHEAGRDYEGDSESEDEGDDDSATKQKRR